ncbi:hypothetical protein OJAV_G00160280 [Oryzias javanicus]|uniref:Uncharacterized protein n=1 Tax=Oryzias javanicus TaxID=123683 RepID=A0A3S2PC27_ORYJA|nr:hypothetical protein OJAV_G00160280 [Oryzias javanicus]
MCQTPPPAYPTTAGPRQSLPTPAVPSPANPRLGVSRASRFLVLRKKKLGAGVGERRRHAGGQRSPTEPERQTRERVKIKRVFKVGEVCRVGRRDPGSVEVVQVGGDASGTGDTPALRAITGGWDITQVATVLGKLVTERRI